MAEYMSVNKLAIAVTVVGTVGLTGCSFINEHYLDVIYGDQVGVVEASVNADPQKDTPIGNDNSNDSTGGSDNRADEQSQTAENNQATMNNLNGRLEKLSIYFLDEGSEIEPKFIPLIEKQSQTLLENSDYALILEGHADERGSREYNIGLGEERAKAVAKIMQARGVRSNQLEIVSYGEEKPASLEHNETAWHLNRRVNLIPQRTQK